MQRFVTVLLGAVVAGSCLFGCDDDDHDVPAPALSELPAVYADTVCGQLVACYGDVAEIMEVTAASCEAALVAQLEDGVLPVWEAAAETGAIEYDGTRVQECLDAITAASCQVMSDRIPAACDAIFNGNVEPGGPCTSDVECAGEAYCRDDGCPGLCVARVEAGGACGESGECASGLTCQGDVCAAPADEGEACGGASNPDCAEGYLCAGEDGDTPGACRSVGDVSLVAGGEACSPEDGVLCEAGLSCVVEELMPLTMTCTAPVSSGAACRAGSPDPCPDGEVCDADVLTGDPEGTCVPVPGEGEPCVGGPLGEQCDADLRCIDEVCRRPQRLGGPCTAAGACYSGLCESGVCAAPGCAL